MSQPTKRPAEHVLTAPAPTETVITGRRLSDNTPQTFAARFRENIQYSRGRGALEIGVIVALVLVGFIIAGLVAPSEFPFLSASNLSGVISQSIPVLALMGIAAGILMIAGEFDLSLGANVGFTAIVFINVSESAGWGWGIIAGLATGTSIALVNGLIVVLTRIPSFIATLGMGFFWVGASIFVNGTSPAILVDGKDDLLVAIFAGDFGFFRSQLLWLIVIGFVMWSFLHRHKLGNHIFAVGGNPSAAKAISIKPNSVRLLAFGVFGLLVAFAAILISVRTGSMQPGSTDDYTLMAIAAAVVGGTSLDGGRGSIIGMVIGAALIRLIENGLILAKAPGFYIQLFVGLIIVIAAIFNKLMEGKAS
ncbi:simple sugar transport system permease protein [Microbacterium trichothecenolyticum]|uniref:ABC transporter permease n=1 Tax=Microbacterium trichothecenolyticum TaxID=69370 RepID=UPI00285CAECC|nr:ABC transporter permease [Microbacterium trichothecenolyticum]MDR7187110.1 simple sugar transport system permease protein [Microbacterium trichothecenolyticum]